MIELLIVAVIVAWALWYSWKKLSKTASGKRSCCEQGGDCAFKNFVGKDGKTEQFNCSVQDREKRQEGK